MDEDEKEGEEKEEEEKEEEGQAGGNKGSPPSAILLFHARCYAPLKISRRPLFAVASKLMAVAWRLRSRQRVAHVAPACHA